jgi:glycosyltransferase involved in cell wall biosynthesis
MIDALGEFCGGPDDTRCVRCIDLAGAHEASRLDDLTPREHRELFERVLKQMTHVAAPSADAVRHLSSAIPGLPLACVPHPQLGMSFPRAIREGSWDNIALLGAIGPHKGSAELLQVARRALLTHPELRFHIIGYTDIDAELRALSNVAITGAYKASDLERLVKGSNSKIALFLHQWPETFSYTLSEAAAHGLVPVVPDIGAPAERVRAAGFGVIFSHPFNPASVLDTLAGIAAGQVPFAVGSATPTVFDDSGAPLRIAALFGDQPVPEITPEPMKPTRRVRPRKT